MSAEVIAVLGSDQFLYGKVGGDEVIARLDPVQGRCGGQSPAPREPAPSPSLRRETERAVL
jgi:hypothetical protein